MSSMPTFRSLILMLKRLLNLASLLAVLIAFGLIYIKNVPGTEAGTSKLDAILKELGR